MQAGVFSLKPAQPQPLMMHSYMGSCWIKSELLSTKLRVLDHQIRKTKIGLAAVTLNWENF